MSLPLFVALIVAEVSVCGGVLLAVRGTHPHALKPFERAFTAMSSTIERRVHCRDN